ncbi:MAG: methyltransferase domain-containing protein [Thermoprotei archaeon]|jgi:16S rRNA C967 or C1407 C5-methylase (RsmB/RsmF family)
MELKNIKRADRLTFDDLKERFSSDILDIFKAVYGNNWLDALSSITKPPKRYFLRINSIDVDYVIDKLNKEGLIVKKYPYIDEAVYIDAEYINYDKLPDFSGVVIADKFASESVIEGANLYAPGVLKMINVKKDDTVAVLDPFGAIVGIGKSKIGSDEFNRMSIRKGIAVNITHPFFKTPPIRELKSFNSGLIYPQSLPSMVTVKELDPRPGETVIDMCAAPGGKLSYIAFLMKMRGRIYGFDRSERKVRILKETLERLNIENVKVEVMDSRYLDLKMPDLQADKIMIDPPCSALGIRPKLASNVTFRKVLDYQQYQIQFLKAASKVLKREGIVVFSVCTITPHEVEEIMSEATNKLPFEPIEQKLFIASSSSLNNYSFGKSIQRFQPHVDDTPGFSIIKMRKI